MAYKWDYCPPEYKGGLKAAEKGRPRCNWTDESITSITNYNIHNWSLNNCRMDHPVIQDERRDIHVARAHSAAN